MKIETKYEIGQEFFTASVVKRFETETVTVNGYEYTRQIYDLKPKIAKKKIIEISIQVNKNNEVTIEYWAEYLNTELSLNHMCEEKDIKFFTYEDALQFAENWIKTENREYFG